MTTAAITTTKNTKASKANSNNKVWIVQQQLYYYSDEYCASAQDPEGWFRTKEAAKKFCGQKNLAAIQDYVSDRRDDLEDHDPVLKFLSLPEECQLKAVVQPEFDTESELGIACEWRMRWYEVVELKLLDE